MHLRKVQASRHICSYPNGVFFVKAARLTSSQRGLGLGWLFIALSCALPPTFSVIQQVAVQSMAERTVRWTGILLDASSWCLFGLCGALAFGIVSARTRKLREFPATFWFHLAAFLLLSATYTFLWVTFTQIVKPSRSADDYLTTFLNNLPFSSLTYLLVVAVALGAPPRDRARARRTVELIKVPTATGYRLLDVAEIAWIEASDYYSLIHANERYLIRESLASLEARLDRGRFVRVHRRAIVNLRFVREIVRAEGGLSVQLKQGTRLSVSRRRRAAVLDSVRAFGTS